MGDGCLSIRCQAHSHCIIRPDLGSTALYQRARAFAENHDVSEWANESAGGHRSARRESRIQQSRNQVSRIAQYVAEMVAKGRNVIGGRDAYE
jgi:hypothetical protein